MHFTYRYNDAGDLLIPGFRYSIERRAPLPIHQKKHRHIRRMSNEVRHFPARLMTPDEQALVGDWLATAGDIALADISKRCNDDPGLHRRIVITAGTLFTRHQGDISGSYLSRGGERGSDAFAR